jgi:alpha-L-rhamnosidase
VGIWVSVKTDSVWSQAAEVVNGIQSDGTRYPCWNPVLFQPNQGPLMLFYKVGPDPKKWWGMLVLSNDGGQTWSAARRLPDGYYGPIKNKPIQLADGTILCPTSQEEGSWRVQIESTDAQAESWQTSGDLNDGKEFGAIQPTILSYPGNKLQLLCRTENEVITECWSEDNGKTWSRMTATSLPNPNSGIDAVTLRDGRQLLVYNPTAKNWGNRVPLSVAISDDGKKWNKIFDLEPFIDADQAEKDEYSYPSVIQTADGMVHIVYTYNRVTVKHVVVDPAKI